MGRASAIEPVSMKPEWPTGEADVLHHRAYYVLFIVTVLNVINLWHRYLLYGLSAVSVGDCEAECDGVPFVPVCDLDEEIAQGSSEEVACLSCRRAYDTDFYNLKDGACIDNSQYGVLAGVGFTLTFALATLFAGRLTDIFDKRSLHTGATLVWSLAAAAHGACNNFECLLIARIFIGIGQAFHAPACYALIAMYFPDSRRATANGVYCAGNYLGAAISSLCLALAGMVGWRQTASLSGLSGVLMAAVLFFTVDHHPVLPSSSSSSVVKNGVYRRYPLHAGRDRGEFRVGSKGGSRDEGKEALRLATALSPCPNTRAKSLSSLTKSKGPLRWSSCRTPSRQVSRKPGIEQREQLRDEVRQHERTANLSEGDTTASVSCYIHPPAPLPSSCYSPCAIEDPNGGLMPPLPCTALKLADSKNVSSRRRRGIEDEYVLSEGEMDTEGHEAFDPRERGHAPGWGLSKVSAPLSRIHHFLSRPIAWSSEKGGVDEQKSPHKFGPSVRLGDAVEAPLSEADSILGGRMGKRVTSSYGSFGEGNDTRLGRKSVQGNGDHVDRGERGPKSGGRVTASLWCTLCTIMGSRVVVLLYAATSARMVATWTLASYLAIYFDRAFPSQTWLYSVLNAIFICAGGVASSYAGGVISDRLRSRSQGFLGYVPAFGAASAILPVAVVLFSSSFSASMVALLLTYLLGECWPGPVMAVLQLEVPMEMTGTSVALLLFLNSIACNIGPWVVAWRDTGMASVREPMFITNYRPKFATLNCMKVQLIHIGAITIWATTLYRIFVSYLLSSFLFCAYGVLVADVPGLAGKGLSGHKKNDERVPGSSTKSTARKVEEPGAADGALGNDFDDGAHDALENGEEANVDL